MLAKIIELSLRHRAAVIFLSAALAAGGAISLQHLDIDAFPDTTPVQVQVNTVAAALSPEEVESQITLPLELAIGGLPGLEEVRSISKFGLSQITVTFADGTEIYRARQLVLERVGTVELPAGVGRPELGPVSTGLGEVFHYIVRSDPPGSGRDGEPAAADLTELRTLQDWAIRPVLRKEPGVAEVNSWGGYKKQYQIRVDPARLIKHRLAFEDVVRAVLANNLNVGGGSLSAAGQMLLVQGVARVGGMKDIEAIVVSSRAGVPVRVADVAEVAVGHEIRRGAVTAQGRGEAVLGLGFLLLGENSHVVTRRLREALESVKPALPPGVRVETVYDRTELVNQVIETVRRNLFEGGLLVVAVLFAFLGSLRAGLVVAVAIPLSMLCAVSGMLRFGIAASLLSLGAIDFGLIVDSSVILVENLARHLDAPGSRGRSRMEIVREATLEVRRPTLFGELVIMIVYLPILTLQGIEGKLFRPMALTVIFALLGSLIFSLTLMPALASLCLPRAAERREPAPVRILRSAYRPVLRFALRHGTAVLGVALSSIAGAAIVARGLGSEFVPRLSEGAIVLNVVRLPGTDLEESIRCNTLMEARILDAFPDEVRWAWSRIGTAEVATDPMGVELTDIFLSLRPRKDWRRARTQDELVEKISKELRELPGQRVAFTQPIEMRLNEIISGTRLDLAVKVFGDDLGLLESTANEIAGVLRSIEGSSDVSVERIGGQPVLRVRIRQEEAARHGISARAVLDVVEAAGGVPLGEVYEGQLRFPLALRLPDALWRDPDALGSVWIHDPSGARIPLSHLADLELLEGPSTIIREWGRRRITIQSNVRGRDVGTFVDEARRRIASEVRLPSPRYRVEFGGQFQHLERARARLLIVVPLTLGLVFALLTATYHRLLDALRVFTGVPFAAAGGVLALWVRDMPFSVSAAIGFIALSGVSVLADMVLVSRIRQLLDRGLPLGEAVEEAALTRLRPVLMTAMVASLGFLPMATSTGVGAEVQRPLATVVIGGLLTSTLLTLFVIPVLYLKFGSALAGLRGDGGRAVAPEGARAS
ncbi:MAG: efflux RND transporter permease subunit [Planctomycetota bacterium]